MVDKLRKFNLSVNQVRFYSAQQREQLSDVLLGSDGGSAMLEQVAHDMEAMLDLNVHASPDVEIFRVPHTCSAAI
jgi:hypothetical protein